MPNARFLKILPCFIFVSELWKNNKGEEKNAVKLGKKYKILVSPAKTTRLAGDVYCMSR